MNRRTGHLVGAALLLLTVAGCASARPAASATPTAVGTAGPSSAARIVCAAEAQEDISGALGIDTTEPVSPNWKDRLYSCRYVYRDGSMLLSVKDLPDGAATRAWFDGLRQAAPGATPLTGLGDAAFAEPDGTVVLRKDATVLTVDVSALPTTFGKPVRPRASAARTVATTVLICWKEG
ncbi:hypothetical protein ABUW04_31080 [Streptacidiphilus sp. N1-10]|uniref:DUF3558 domain-containing protein n=1 Tax=Streptacidiphilus jeojiensis TaxID=3229225 RepID=A0ABV6XWQ2_9ACTN